MTSPSTVVFERTDLTSPNALALIEELNEELRRQYPEPGANHFRLDPDEVGEGRGAFLVGRQEGVPIACGAVRRLEDGRGELKRMYVNATLRGQGIGARLLAALEDEARGLGCDRLVLETGTRQLAALALYQRAGFAPIPPWGEYKDTPTSVCLGKDL